MDKIKALNLDQAKSRGKEEILNNPLERKPFLSFQEENPLVYIGGFVMVEINLSPGFNRTEGYGWVTAIAGHGDAILCKVKCDGKYCIMNGGIFKNIILNDMTVANPQSNEYWVEANK